MNRATRTDVARLAGISTAVVSYVIKGDRWRMSTGRRERALAGMRELGYQPNAIARSLSSTRTNTTGMIVPNVGNACFAELTVAVEYAAIERGLLVILGNASKLRFRENCYVTNFTGQRVR